MVLAAVTLFCASALLFMVQPMTGRQVLPLLGGTPAVWTTCMLFFQLVLVGGYWYAHRAPRWLGKRHPRWHLVVLAVAMVPLWIPIPAFWNTFDGAAAVLGLLLMLAVTVGLPFFALATTSPLVQHWFAGNERTGGRSPYVLFAASNAGSLVGLLAYPLFVEPAMRLGEQRTLWAAAYGLVALATAACALTQRPEVATAPAVVNPAMVNEVVNSADPVAVRQKLWWLSLAFAPSSLLLGVTTHITTNLAPVPLLWAIPLALYLLTFVIAFSWQRAAPVKGARPVLPRWLPPFVRWTESPRPVTAILPALLLPLVVLFHWERAGHGPLLLLLHLGTFFLAALACHGRLADLRPAPARLTEYYLCIAVGGALGGICNALVAPFVFPGMVEYPLLLAVLCCLLLGPVRPRADVAWGCAIVSFAIALFLAAPRVDHFRFVVLGPPALLALMIADRPLRLGIAVGGLLLVGSLFNDRGTQVIWRDRSVFGAHRVERLSPDVTCLVHGDILHGTQDHRPEQRREPLTYYHRAGPCGEIFAALAGRIPGGRVGAVGLGIGSIAAYGAAGEHWTFFEIDAAVERTARAQFTFLEDSAARVDVQIGDGRLLLARARDAEFGVILLDAFNSDAVPVHLLTREAVAIYLAKLAPRGLLAFHVSSRYVDLPPILGDLAADAGLVARLQHESQLSAEAAGAMRNASKWVVMARRAEDLVGLQWSELVGPGRPVWTDDYSSLLQVLRLFP